MAAPGESSTSATTGSPPPHGDALVFVVGGRIDRGHIPGLCDRARAALMASDAELVVCDVGAVVDPDAVTVEALGRLKLVVREFGRRVTLGNVSGELQDLLTLMGLCDALPVGNGLSVESRRQTEQREQALGVEEERDPADPTV